MSYSAFNTKTDDKIFIRPARWSDLPGMVDVAISVYRGTPLHNYLSPGHETYPVDSYRGYHQRIAIRWLSPRNLSFVACPSSDPQTVVGYIQFFRRGEDDGAKAQMAARKSLWLWILSWYYTVLFAIVNYVWPNRATDRNALRKFETWVSADNEIHWKPFPDRQERWHVQSIVVDEKWQGRGIGKRLMSEVLRRAGEEGVVVGLEASPEGECLYRSVGFELLGRFSGETIGVADQGGIMLWRPERRKPS